MTLYKLLPEFFNNGYFNQGNITVYSSNFTMSKGHPVSGTPTTEVIKTQKVLVPMNTKDLEDTGLGEFVGNEAFNLYTAKQLKFSNGTLLQKGDMISYDGSMYKIISSLNYKTHGFYNYVIVKFKGETLND